MRRVTSQRHTSSTKTNESNSSHRRILFQTSGIEGVFQHKSDHEGCFSLPRCSSCSPWQSIYLCQRNGCAPESAGQKCHNFALGGQGQSPQFGSAVDGGAEWLHFSVQDGRMIPKISFGTAVVEACRKAFPTTVLDVKLGCVEPEHCISDFVKVGADIISVHPESTLQLGAVINKIHASGVAPGVVLNPGTSISAVEHVLHQCQVAVVMLVCVEELVPGSLEFVDFI